MLLDLSDQKTSNDSSSNRNLEKLVSTNPKPAFTNLNNTKHMIDSSVNINIDAIDNIDNSADNIVNMEMHLLSYLAHVLFLGEVLLFQCIFYSI